MVPSSSSSPGWTTTSAQPLLSPTMCPLDLLSSVTPTMVITHSAQPHLPFTSHFHDTPTSLSTGSSPTGAVSEALNNLFLIDPSDDYKRTAELLDIGLPSYIDGPYPPSPHPLPPSILDTKMSETAGIAAMMGLTQQYQIGDFGTEQHGSRGAGIRQSVSDWGIVETAGFLLDDMHFSTTTSASSSEASSNGDSLIEQFLQQQQQQQQQQHPQPPPVQQPEESSSYPQGRRQQELQQQLLQEQWLIQRQQQPQHNTQNQTTVSTLDHLQPQYSMWPLWPSMNQHQQHIASPQNSLQLEHFIPNPCHHIPHILSVDHFQQHQGCPPLQAPPSPSSPSTPFKHHQHPSLSYNTFEHPHNQQQEPHPHPRQQYHHLRRNINHHHLHHHHHPQYHHRVPVIQSLKRRRRLTAEESEFLMLQFNLNGCPTAQERDSFARHLKLDRRTIQVWFQNRRAKLKRDERGQGRSAVGSGGGRREDEEDEGDDGERGGRDREANIIWGSGAGVGEGGLDQEPRYPQQMVHQDHHQQTVDNLSQLLPPHQYQIIPSPHAFNIFDLEGEGSGDSEDLGPDFLQTWNSSSNNNSNNSESNYTAITTITTTTNSSENSIRGETGMGMGQAETARLRMELLSGQHCQSYQYQYQHQQDADHLPYPLQRWSLPLVESGVSFRDCPP